MKPWVFKLVLVVGALAMTRLAWAEFENSRLRAKLRASELAEANARARGDSTRDVTNELRQLLGEYKNAVEHLAEQVEIRTDKIDNALGRYSQVQARIEVRIGTLETKLKSGPTTETSEGVRHAQFRLEQPIDTTDVPPYTIQAEVAVPPPPDSATMQLTVALAPAHFDARVQCARRATDAGVRDATLLVTGPRWIKLTLDSLRADPDVCSPEKRGSTTKAFIRGGVVVGGLMMLLRWIF